MNAPRMYQTLTYRCSDLRDSTVQNSESPIRPPPMTRNGPASQRGASSHSIPSL
jgi:hypothetical protein